MQRLTTELAIYRALRYIGFREGETVLDVGGYDGGSLMPFRAAGALAADLTSVDIMAAGKLDGERRLPGVTHITCDAQRLPFPTGKFDIVHAMGMFPPIADDTVACAIAREMHRVTRPGGRIIVGDWQIARGGRGITRSRIRELFGLPIEHVEKGAIIQPVGRRISKYAPWAYFLAQPFLPGLRVHVMRAFHP